MKIHVTVINGFLGAGKTTLLRALLAQSNARPDIQFGIIVNEMSELDVDGELLDIADAVPDDSPYFASLPAGSISSRDGVPRFHAAVQQVCGDGKVSHLLIETSGSTHPWPLLQAIQTHPDLELHGFFSVADTLTLARDFDNGRAIVPAASQNLSRDRRGIENLLAEQVMFANCILLSKVDRVEPKTLQQVGEALHPLNPYANILGIQWGNISLDAMLSVPEYDFHRVAQLGAELGDWEETHGNASLADPTSYLIGSRVIKDPRPFHPQRLWDTYHKLLGVGIYRSKGFFWLPTRDNMVLLWNQTAGSIGLELLTYWKISALEDKSLNLFPEEEAGMRQKLIGMSEDFGDRCCRLTVIGNEADLDYFVDALEKCFCTSNEIDAWKAGASFEDPWPATVARLSYKS